MHKSTFRQLFILTFSGAEVSSDKETDDREVVSSATTSLLGWTMGFTISGAEVWSEKATGGFFVSDGAMS